MSGGDDSAEKTLEPSQKKLDDARAKGDIPRSTDLHAAAAYAGMWLVALALGGASLVSMGDVLMSLIERPEAFAAELLSPQGAAAAGGLMLAVGLAALPVFAAPMLGVALSIAAQNALVFAPSKLEPKLSRLSPIQGAKNKFGPDGLWEFAKSSIKLVVFSAVLAWVFARALPELLVLTSLEPRVVVGALMGLLPQLLLPVVALAALIGVADALWQRASHIRKNRMSRKELSDEHKDQEGDPHLKSARRARAEAIAQNRMMAEVPTADVVLVNPTHYAVALRWSRMAGSAPMVVAKGVDHLAARIREAAHEAGVPVRADPPTARALHDAVALGQEIPPDHYRAVAAAIRFAEAMRARGRRS